MSRPILITEAQLLPLLDGSGTPITGTNADKLVGRFANLRVQHNFDASAWDVTLEGSIDGVNFETVPGTANMTGNGIVDIPDHWTTFRLVSNTVDTLGSYSLVLGGLEVDETNLFVDQGGGGGGGGGTPALVTLSSASTSNTTAIGDADVYRMTTAGTTLTIQTADITEGRVFIIRAIAASGGSPVTIATQGAETIDGGASITLTNPYASVTLQATGGVLESIA